MKQAKSILITGCSSGIGYATALKFARNGYNTIASARNPDSEGAKELLKTAKKEKLPLELVQVDVRNDESVVAGVSKAIKLAGKIDILVNNAGFGYLGPIENFTIDEVKDQFETNVYGILRVTKEVAPHMRKNGSGTIINISSVAGFVSFPLFSVYSASKFAVEALSEGFRFELKHFGINVVTVEPGSFLTKFADNRRRPKAFYDKKSPYKTLVNNFFERYDKTHDKAKASIVSKVLTPEPVVETIYKIARTRNPRSNYIVGYDALMFTTLKKFITKRVWEFLLHKIYKW